MSSLDQQCTRECAPKDSTACILVVASKLHEALNKTLVRTSIVAGGRIAWVLLGLSASQINKLLLEVLFIEINTRLPQVAGAPSQTSTIPYHTRSSLGSLYILP